LEEIKGPSSQNGRNDISMPAEWPMHNDWKYLFYESEIVFTQSFFFVLNK